MKCRNNNDENFFTENISSTNSHNNFNRNEVQTDSFVLTSNNRLQTRKSLLVLMQNNTEEFNVILIFLICLWIEKSKSKLIVR